ncbi:hypothetical protein ACFL00_00845 [Pseudomonadota bacterium]
MSKKSGIERVLRPLRCAFLTWIGKCPDFPYKNAVILLKSDIGFCVKEPGFFEEISP